MRGKWSLAKVFAEAVQVGPFTELTIQEFNKRMVGLSPITSSLWLLIF